MLKRMLVMLTVTLALVAGLGFVKFRQIQSAIAQGAAFQPPPEAVTTIVASQEKWPSTLTAIGTVAAVRGVTVSADLPGVVDRISFESGQSIREGEVLAVLDMKQEHAQLAAAEAQRELAEINFTRMEGLLNERVVSRAEFDRAQADRRQADAHVGEIRAAIDRKTIKAPFSGVLGIRHVNLGQYLSGGDALVTVACHEDLTGSDLVGRYLIEGDETVWIDGPLTQAVKTGAICYLDEIVEARKDTTVLIHPLTDHRRILPIDKRGEIIEALENLEDTLEEEAEEEKNS
jgi:multidrug efflux pump subunit AcrA (membrane-fusion protein)